MNPDELASSGSTKFSIELISGFILLGRVYTTIYLLERG